jgi:hypothetical protein
MALFLPEVMFDADNERERTEAVTGREVGGYCSASSAWRFGQGGDLSDGFGAWADVPHRGARVAVPVGCQKYAWAVAAAMHQGSW